MPSETTTFRVRFTAHLNLSSSALANIANNAAEDAKRGEIMKFVFAAQNPEDLADPANCASCADPSYVAAAQAYAWQSGGGFYFERGEIYLKIKCQRAFDLDAAYTFYHEHGLSAKAFPKDRIDESSKSYPSIKSLKPLIFTPSYQYGTIRQDAEDEFYHALLANDWVAKDILIHCLPGVEIECPFYVTFNSFVVKFGGPSEDDHTSDLFYEVGIDKVIRSHGHVKVPNTSRKYFFLKRSNLLNTERFIRFQDIRHELVYMEPDETCLFVTHDWERVDLPDPQSRQYKGLVQLLQGENIAFQSQHVTYGIGTRTFLIHEPLQTDLVSPDAFEHIWYDYSCLPQEPRDHDEELLFREQLANLPNIFRSKVRTVQIGNQRRQKSRAWCVMEQEIAKRNNGINLMFKAEEANVGISYDGVDLVFARSRLSLQDTYTTNVDDMKIVEWMLYKSLADALTQRERREW